LAAPHRLPLARCRTISTLVGRWPGRGDRPAAAAVARLRSLCRSHAAGILYIVPASTISTRPAWTTPSSLGSQRRAGLGRGRRPRSRPRPARHRPLPAWTRSHQTHLPLQRPLLPPHRSLRHGGARNSGVRLFMASLPVIPASPDIETAAGLMVRAFTPAPQGLPARWPGKRGSRNPSRP
jgi:hypothetical protein